MLKPSTVDGIYRDVIERARQRDANKPEPRKRKRIAQPEPMALRDYTAEEWTELGRQMAADPKAITTNVEGLAYLHYTTEQKRQLRDKYGCCGDEPDCDGFCYGLGKCPRHAEVNLCVNFVAGFMDWLDQINEQTGLAAVAVRLDVSSPFIESENCNV